MKKLMIAAVVAAFGIAVNAATTSWEISNVVLLDGMEDATAYLVMADSSVVSGWGAMSVDDATAAIKNHNAASVIANALQAEDGTPGYSIYEYTSLDSLGYDADGNQVITASDTTTSAYLVLLSDDGSLACLVDTADPVYFGATGLNDGFAFGDISSITSDSNNWYSTAAVPEPTSGLLLLLGVAGLALRRRRA